MSEAADKICEAIIAESKKLREEVLASVKIDLPLQEVERMGERFKDDKFHAELEKRIIDVLQWISPGCRVTFPLLQGGSSKCFGIKMDAPGRVLDSLQAEAFAFPRK